MANIKQDLKNPLHPIQMQILNKLLFMPKAKYGQLRDKNIPTDQFTYHLNKLVQLGLITKNNGFYTLTDKGKQFSSSIDTETAQQEKFGKRGVLLRAIKRTKNTLKYLVYKRLKQPFYGYIGFHTGKIRFGEFPLQTAFREFKEETGLTIKDYELVGIYHQIGKNPHGQIMRDIYFYTFNIYSFVGKLIKKNLHEGVLNMWLTKNQIKKHPTYPDFWAKDYRTNWQFLPTYYRRYLKLKSAGKWKNKPSNSQYAIKVDYVRREKIIKEW